MVLIDLSKAFDNLRHSTLLTKLQLLGTRLREGTPLVQAFLVRQTAVYSNWNIIVGSPNDNPRDTSGVHFRPDAVYTLYH